MKVHEVTPNPDCGALLPDAQFIDAHRVDIGDTDIDAREACVRMVLHPPRWIDALIRLRNILVSPFGLKTSGEGAPAPGGLIGLFPVVSETPERLVAGFNDYHLDFRLVVDVNNVSGRPAGHVDDAGADAQFSGTRLSHPHHAVSQAGRAQHDAADRRCGPMTLWEADPQEAMLTAWLGSPTKWLKTIHLVIARSASDEAIQTGSRGYISGLLRFARNDGRKARQRHGP